MTAQIPDTVVFFRIKEIRDTAIVKTIWQEYFHTGKTQWFLICSLEHY